MAKKRTVIGSVTKSLNDNSFYIKVNEDVVLKKGMYLNLEDEKTQLAAVDYALAQGWIDEPEAERRKNQTVAFWNAPINTKDGKSFVRKASTKYQVVLVVKDN